MDIMSIGHFTRFYKGTFKDIDLICPLFRASSKISIARTFRSNAKSIVERESARHISPATHIAEEAMSFIRRNALKGIGAADVARHLRVSRRLCDLRFRECHGETVLEAILMVRFAELKRRLLSSKTSIGKIVAACGFSCESHAKRMFKMRFGMSMREWRASQSP